MSLYVSNDAKVNELVPSGQSYDKTIIINEIFPDFKNGDEISVEVVKQTGEGKTIPVATPWLFYFRSGGHPFIWLTKRKR